MAAKLTQCQQNAIRLHTSLFEAAEVLRALPVTPLTSTANGATALPRGSVITSLDYHPDESPSGITSKLKGVRRALRLSMAI
jgi:hypothetical protein